MATIRGGEEFVRQVREIVEVVGNGGVLRVGFLAGATYPDGKPVAMIAAIQEYGAPGAGIPPRPFFRSMVASKGPEWPKAIADLIHANGYDVGAALNLAGFAIAGQLRQSIIDTNTPPLAPSTIRKKGFAKPLIETSHMINSIDHEVDA